MDLGIAGRRAAVAASTKGLGYACAAALVAEDAQVAVSGRDPSRVRAVAASLGATGVVADFSHPDGGTAFVEEARAALGGIDILVTNAGGPPAGTFEGTGLDAYLEAFELNCRSAIAMCAAAIPEMRERHWGRVVAITSVGVKAPIANLIASSTARAALTAFLKVTAREVAHDGVTVNSVLPGFHRTDRLTQLHDDVGLERLAQSVPARAIGDPDDFGRVCAFLCSESARYITGESLLVDGGVYSGLI